MPGNSFIKFAEIPKGESFQDGHLGTAGWIEIGDWSWDIEAETSYLKGGGSAVGKPTPGNLSFSHFYDLGSPVIMTKIVAGTHFSQATIDMLKQVGAEDGKPAVYLQIVMKDVYVTKVSTKGGEDGSVNQDVEMVFKQVAVAYKAQLNTGKLEDSPKLFGWNIPQMTLDSTAKTTI